MKAFSVGLSFCIQAAVGVPEQLHTGVQAALVS